MRIAFDLYHRHIPGRVNRVGGQVIFVDYIYDSEMPVLYNMATVFAYPSLYEAFGLPAAEALACGVPILVSTDGTLSEVVSDVALTVLDVYRRVAR